MDIHKVFSASKTCMYRDLSCVTNHVPGKILYTLQSKPEKTLHLVRCGPDSLAS